jgi:bacterioferritin
MRTGGPDPWANTGVVRGVVLIVIGAIMRFDLDPHDRVQHLHRRGARARLVVELMGGERAVPAGTKEVGVSFQTDIEGIRERARRRMQEGPVTEDYRADREKVIELLNDVVATEIVCVLRYKRHQFTAVGLYAQPVAQEFAEHAAEEQGHLDLAAQRIVQLGGEPNLDPSGLSERSHTEYRPGVSLVDMVKEDLVAERIVIQTYAEMIRWIGDDDPTTRRVLETILEQEEEHADDLRDLLADLDPELPGVLHPATD